MEKVGKRGWYMHEKNGVRIEGMKSRMPRTRWKNAVKGKNKVIDNRGG